MIKRSLFFIIIVFCAFANANAQTFIFNRTNYIKNVKSGSGASNIVTDGLKINLDAGNTSSYSGTGTTWTDLSGNSNSMAISTYLANTYTNSNGGNFFWDMGRHQDRNNTSYSLPTGVWKHAVMTGNLEGGSIKTRIYVDGVLIITQDEGVNSIPNLTDIFIGSGESDNIYLVNGNISICRVYNKALSSSEVLQNFNADKTRFGL